MGQGDNMGILCMGTVVKERNQGSEERCMEHMQSSKKRGRDLMIKYGEDLFTNSRQ